MKKLPITKRAEWVNELAQTMYDQFHDVSTDSLEDMKRGITDLESWAFKNQYISHGLVPYQYALINAITDGIKSGQFGESIAMTALADWESQIEETPSKVTSIYSQLLEYEINAQYQLSDSNEGSTVNNVSDMSQKNSVQIDSSIQDTDTVMAPTNSLPDRIDIVNGSGLVDDSCLNEAKANPVESVPADPEMTESYQKKQARRRKGNWCGRCKTAKYVTFSTKQSSCADEMSKVTYKCTQCGKSWT
ncbi:MAG: hypothetical protein Sylvanvirus20_9 [Sylvanvirus sp.]|uniref:TFIIS-type domain-containing protein n=1 Tax=Sylvanvirus sp. TaxID=2487774 RepID=A0A3G5AL50_9VIRU|nr:MAG: hypothetical protein Sylvanvirus20_9 [Sylvanvirus sp.]